MMEPSCTPTAVIMTFSGHTPSAYRHRPPAPRRPRIRPLVLSLLAYLSFVSASVAAAVALVGEDLPMEVLVSVL
jgi:hypothetical protein